MIDSRETKLLVANGTLGDQLTQMDVALSVRVDNHSSAQWLHLVNTQEYIGPGTMGAIVQLPEVDQALAEWAAPPGTVQGAPVVGQTAVLTYYSYPQDPSPGLARSVDIVSGSVAISAGTVAVENAAGTQLSSRQDQALIATLATGAGGTGLSIPVGTHSILLELFGGGGGSATQNLTLHPSAQGITPIAVPFTISSHQLYVAGPVPSGYDTTVDVPAIGAGVGQNVIAVLDPLYVLAAIVNNVKVEPGNQSLSVFESKGPISTFYINVTLAAGVAATVVVGVTGQSVYMHGYNISADTATSALPALPRLRDSVPTNFHQGYAAAPGQCGAMDLKGAQSYTGAAVQVVNAGGASSTFFGALGYSQF